MTEPDWLLPGAIKEEQSVTPNWEKLDQRLIEGVIVKEVRHVPTSYGHLTELFRTEWQLGANITQAFQGRFQPGALSAWHAHAVTQDAIFVNGGMLRVLLYDSRKNSKTRKIRFLPRDGGSRSISRSANGMIATRSRFASPT